MLVNIYKDGRQRSGLHIGEANARRYFSKRAPSIELRLDDLRIQCTLSPDFWKDHPEILDSRLSEWLEFKAGRRSHGAPIALRLIPSGPDAFVVCAPAEAVYDEFGADVCQGKKVRSESILPHRHRTPVEEYSVA
jgi:hypothetical protein